MRVVSSEMLPGRIAVLLSCIVLFLLSSSLRAEEVSTASPLSAAATAAWAEAQQAQQQKDYATAAREYRKVISLSSGFAEAYMNLGLIDEIQNRLPDSVAMFEKAVQLKPSLAGAQFFLGVDYCKLGDARRATPHLEAAVRARPNLPDAWSWLASAYQQTGRISLQITTLQAGLRANPASVDLLYLLGQAYEQQGKDAVDRIQQEHPESSWLEQLLAENYVASGYLSVAMLHLENALKTSPERSGLHLEMAEIMLHAGNLQRAGDEIEAEPQIAAHSLRALVRRGEVELLRSDTERALTDWSEALALDPARCQAILGLREFGFGDASQEKLPDSLRGRLAGVRSQIESSASPARQLALAFISSQEDASAAVGAVGEEESNPVTSVSPCTVPQVKTWLAADRLQLVAGCSNRILSQPLTPDLRLEMARALYETGLPDRALAALDGLARTDVNTPEVQYVSARCYNRLALAAYLRLFEVDPDSHRAHQVLGDLDETRGDDSKAIAEYEKALALRPTLPNLHYQIGHLKWKSYETEEARAQFQAELAINPRHSGALFDLGSTYLQAHQADQALEYLRKAGALDPQYPDLHEFLGIAYSQLHRYSDAEKELKLAEPGDRDGAVHYQLARVYTSLGKPDEAKREFALSDELRVATHRANEERVQRIAAAEAALKQP